MAFKDELNVLLHKYSDENTNTYADCHLAKTIIAFLKNSQDKPKSKKEVENYFDMF